MLRVLICGAAADFLIIGHDRLLDRRIDRLAKNHRLLTNILDNHVDIADLHNIISCGFSRIHLHGLHLVLLFLW